jgi:putative toxin-antitoxin system, toxin component
MRKVRFNVFQNNQALKELKTKGYSLYNFEEIFIDDSKNHIKIASNEYQITGNTAIVDQGQNLIVGFSDRIVKQLDKPRIIFGDHTKAVKFIDFPFILGADGTKVLKLIHESVLEKYVYYFLKYVEIPNLGYARHFKYIKELVFPIPSLSVQKDVINIFTKIDQQISLRQQQLQTLATLVKSRFYEMFGDPQNNPKLIPTKFLGEVCTVERGGSPRPIAEFITDSNDGINWIKIGDTDGTRYISTTAEKIIPEGVKKSRMVKAGDLILSNSMSFGHPYIVKIDGCIHDGWLVLHFDTMIFDAVYLQTYLGLPVVYTIFKTMAVGGVVNNLNSKIVKELPILVPDIKQQNQFADFVAEVDKSQLACQKSLDELETLKKSLMQAYFG